MPGRSRGLSLPSWTHRFWNAGTSGIVSLSNNRRSAVHLFDPRLSFSALPSGTRLSLFILTNLFAIVCVLKWYKTRETAERFQGKCTDVEGCSSALNAGVNPNIPALFTPNRQKRQLTIDQLRQALAQNPDLQRQLHLLGLAPAVGGSTPGTHLPPRQPPLVSRPAASQWQQHLASLAGEHIVKKRLIVVNSESDLQYYLRTGSVPKIGWGKRWLPDHILFIFFRQLSFWIKTHSIFSRC